MKKTLNLSTEIKRMLNEAIRYTLAGIPATLVDFGLLFLLKEYYGLHYLVAALISFVCSLIVSYILSINFVFKNYYKSKFNVRVMFFYAAVSVIGIAINEGVMAFIVETLKLHYLIAKVLATCVVVAWNFLGKKGLIFNSYVSQNKNLELIN